MLPQFYVARDNRSSADPNFDLHVNISCDKKDTVTYQMSWKDISIFIIVNEIWQQDLFVPFSLWYLLPARVPTN